MSPQENDFEQPHRFSVRNSRNLFRNAVRLVAQVVVPPAAYSLNAQAGAGNDFPLFTSTAPGTLQSSGSSGLGSGSTSVTVGGFPAASINITGSIAPGPDGPGGSVQSFASITYYFQVIPPDCATGVCDPNLLIPIDIRGSIITSESGGGNDLLASAAIQAVSSLNSRVSVFAACNFASGCGVLPVDGTIQVLPALGTIYDPAASLISMSASVLGVTQPQGGTANSFIDAILTIDPAFAATHPGYSIEVSDGIGNAAPVPEPSSLALVLAGLAVTGQVIRRRQQRET